MASTLQIYAMKEAGVMIAAVHLPDGYVTMESGMVLPITAYYDEEWDATGDIDEAVYYEFGTPEIGFSTSRMPDDFQHGDLLH